MRMLSMGHNSEPFVYNSISSLYPLGDATTDKACSATILEDGSSLLYSLGTHLVGPGVLCRKGESQQTLAATLL